MRYDISKPSAPMMPNLGKGTECIKILLYRPQKHAKNRLFRYLSLSKANILRFKITIPNPQLEGILWHNGQPYSRK